MIQETPYHRDNVPVIPSDAISSNTAPAKHVPSLGDVPRPISSTKIRDLIPHCLKRLAISPISAPNADFPSDGTSAEAPRMNILSNLFIVVPFSTGEHSPHDVNNAVAKFYKKMTKNLLHR